MDPLERTVALVPGIRMVFVSLGMSGRLFCGGRLLIHYFGKHTVRIRIGVPLFRRFKADVTLPCILLFKEELRLARHYWYCTRGTNSCRR